MQAINCLIELNSGKAGHLAFPGAAWGLLAAFKEARSRLVMDCCDARPMSASGHVWTAPDWQELF